MRRISQLHRGWPERTQVSEVPWLPAIRRGITRGSCDRVDRNEPAAADHDEMCTAPATVSWSFNAERASSKLIYADFYHSLHG
jgi:hypothetical protein